MKYAALGKSDLKVSRICMGCMGFGNAASGQHSWTLDENSSNPPDSSESASNDNTEPDSSDNTSSEQTSSSANSTSETPSNTSPAEQSTEPKPEYAGKKVLVLLAIVIASQQNQY